VRSGTFSFGVPNLFVSCEAEKGCTELTSANGGDVLMVPSAEEWLASRFKESEIDQHPFQKFAPFLVIFVKSIPMGVLEYFS